MACTPAYASPTWPPSAEHIQADRLRVTTQKTRTTLTVPVRPEARPLLARVSEGTLRPLANQKLNGHLKELARLAEIDAPTERVRCAGGQRRAHTAPKYEFVTTHTACRTFVTLALEAGVRPDVVMRITGHKSLTAFQRYVNVTEDSMLDEFSRAFAQPARRLHFLYPAPAAVASTSRFPFPTDTLHAGGQKGFQLFQHDGRQIYRCHRLPRCLDFVALCGAHTPLEGTDYALSILLVQGASRG